MKLDEQRIATLEKGKDLEVPVRIADLERALFVADVVDLDTGEVIFEANDLAPEDLEEQAQGA